MPKKRRTKKQEQVDDDPEAGSAPAQAPEVEVESVKNVPRVGQSAIDSDNNDLESFSSIDANDVPQSVNGKPNNLSDLYQSQNSMDQTVDQSISQSYQEPAKTQKKPKSKESKFRED